MLTVTMASSKELKGLYQRITMINYVRTAISMVIVHLRPRVTLFIRSVRHVHVHGATMAQGREYCCGCTTQRGGCGMLLVAREDIDRRSGM